MRILLFSGKVETFQFQWGYFLLWLLFWFLIVVVHVSYLADGLRDKWAGECDEQNQRESAHD